METIAWIIKGMGLSGEAAIPIIVALLLMWGFIRIVHGNENPVELWHFFSTFNDRAGREYGDINSLGMMAGIVVCLYIPMWLVYKTNDINPFVLGVCLVYLGGVKMFAGWLRMVAARRYAPTAEPAEIPAHGAKREVTFTTEDKTTTQEGRK